ncbi:hypothetical protein [Bradyrhizobium sp. URHA0013]|uniref:hypothetical protein n=1 Tax=Bradyrhizobium sp. URHA0013 TaxID=1380352 RepID=UPI0012DD2742|nr:hypothetical protein [Bradyrhizobium sp. URHA0013]
MATKDAGSVRSLFTELKKTKPKAFPKVGMRLEAPNEQGVYVIYSPSGKVLHVGRTYRGTNGLRQRLANHLHAASSFTEQYLKGHGARLRSGYKFAFLAVPQPRQRALLEALAIGLLCPAHLGLGEKKQ